MREILFRAKRIDNGEWIEGFPFAIYYDGQPMLCIGTEPLCVNDYSEIIGENVSWALVDEETLCQYTGLKDKNGNRIWENDIIRVENSIDEGTGMVEFYGGMWYVDKGVNNSLYDIMLYDDEAEVCVMGNIFDNPELLRQDGG